MAVVIKAYYDGSGSRSDRNARFLTLAGYAGTPRAWQQVEGRWHRVLNRFGCKYLHMKEARALQKAFARRAGWSHERVTMLLADLFNECLAPTAWEDFRGEFRGTACTVNLEDYARVLAEAPSRAAKEPESICVDFVVTVALMSLPENAAKPLGKEGTVELFFDKNESFMHMIDRVWRSRRNNELGDPLRLVSNIAEVDMRQAVGLQAADLLAWHTNRYYTHGMKELSGSFAGIYRVLAAPCFSHYYNYARLKRLGLS